MKNLILVLTAWMLTGVSFNLSAQCPTLYDLKVDNGSEATICAPGQVELSVRGIQMPSGGEINWLYSEDANFDPRTQGTNIGKTNLPTYNQQSCPQVCPDLLMIMMNSCDEDGIGVGKEHDNEFFIFSSGSGFYASDLQFKINPGTNDNTATDKSINIGANPCLIQKPSNALMTRLKTGACSSLNIFAAGPGDFIPSDALVIFFMSSNVAQDYDLTTLCGSGHNVYVMQNSCQRTMGAFTNSSSTSTTASTRYRENFLSLRNCTKCTDSLNYDRRGMKDLEGEYIIDNDFQYASVANGSIVLNTGSNPCQTPDLSNYLKPSDPYKIYFGVPAGSPLCGKKVYFKAIVTPYDPLLCTEVIADGAALNIKCGGSTLTATAPETVCSGNPLEIKLNPAGEYNWTVSATAAVAGVSNGSGNVSSIVQTPVYTGGQQATVTYVISSTSTDCPVDPVTVQVKVGPALTASISGNTQICAGGKTTLTFNGNASGIVWSTGATTPSIEVSAAGTYTVDVSNGICTATASVEVKVADELKPVITGNASICQGGSTTFTVMETYDSYMWSTGDQTASITAATPGTYTVTVKKGDCTGTASVELKVAELNIVENVTNETCAGNDGAVTLQIPSGVNYSIVWSSGETANFITGKPAGTYTYTIQYSTCTQVGSVEITKGETALTADIIVDPINCDASVKGAITISNIGNGTAPYTITVNGTSTDETIDGLDEGDYTIVIKDSKGCSVERIINVFQAPAVQVTLPQDLSITQGQQITLTATSITGIQQTGTVYEWTPSTSLSCTNCASPVASPQEKITYVLTVTNSYGCEGSDTIVIDVLPVMSVYLPNAFSPNGDGKNDVLYILSNTSGTRVKILEIFNRWGESVYKIENALVNDATVGWNGQYKGKLAPIDNYSYYYEVVFPDNTVRRDKGTVLIVR